MYAYHVFLSKSWRPPRHIREKTEEHHDRIRAKYHIIVEGEDIPPPIPTFTVSFANANSV